MKVFCIVNIHNEIHENIPVIKIQIMQLSVIKSSLLLRNINFCVGW